MDEFQSFESRRVVLIYVKGIHQFRCNEFSMWQPISTAPADRDLKLAVIDESGTHSLIFPCRRILSGWANAATGMRVPVNPTHWRPWSDRDEQD